MSSIYFNKPGENLLTAMILTYNEEPNILRTLRSVEWVQEILVVDSGSTDKTLEIVNSFANTRVVSRRFDTFASQCNFGLKEIHTKWVLSIDADYVVSKKLSIEISEMLASNHEFQSQVDGFEIKLQYCVLGQPIRSGLLPPRICLYKRELAAYIDVGHGHRVSVDGVVKKMTNSIYHDDRKSVTRWLNSQMNYQSKEAEYLRNAKSTDLPIQDLLRKHTFFAPFVAVVYCLILRGGILDGKKGLLYACQRVLAESILYLYMHTYYRDMKS